MLQLLALEVLLVFGCHQIFIQERVDLVTKLQSGKAGIEPGDWVPASEEIIAEDRCDTAATAFAWCSLLCKPLMQFSKSALSPPLHPVPCCRWPGEFDLANERGAAWLKFSKDACTGLDSRINGLLLQTKHLLVMGKFREAAAADNMPSSPEAPVHLLLAQGLLLKESDARQLRTALGVAKRGACSFSSCQEVLLTHVCITSLW